MKRLDLRPTKPTHDEFVAYVKVQNSGITNMNDVSYVQDLSGLEKAVIFDIMHNYKEYSKEYGINMENINAQ